ncbi:MAG TPA: MerR family transcriptional regulator [Deltaproteobacteria bacterium]|jgi:AcrR family transcriptional regulator|nr:MerR family transcriptional regulator [Deltaproteobacteria bacterium]
MIESKSHLGIADLSTRSGIPVSTIKFYLREGLLPKPIKTSKTRAYYTAIHVKRLKLIKKLRDEENISLKNIKEIINLVELENKDYASKMLTNTEKDKIINNAVSLFIEKGYERTTIADIVSSSGIGRSTFYKNYKNKKELFTDCFKKIFWDITTEGDRLASEGADALTILKKRTLTYFKAYPEWASMMSLLKAAAISDPDEFSEQLKETLLLFVDECNKLLQAGIKQGIFREIDSVPLSVVLMGGVELFCYYYSSIENDADREKLIDNAWEIILKGLSK